MRTPPGRRVSNEKYIYVYINLRGGGWISRFLSPDGPRICFFFFLVKIEREGESRELPNWQGTGSDVGNGRPGVGGRGQDKWFLPPPHNLIPDPRFLPSLPPLICSFLSSILYPPALNQTPPPPPKQVGDNFHQCTLIVPFFGGGWRCKNTRARAMRWDELCTKNLKRKF